MTPSLSSVLVLAASAGVVSAYAPPTSFTAGSRVMRRHKHADTVVHENFGLDFAEDSYENTPDVILGEERYKQWVGTVNDNSFLNRQYNAVRRIREKDLIGLTAEYGILSKLEKNGVDLAKIEELLPVAEELGLLSLVANNQQLLVNAVAPLLIEPAPLLLPLVAGALDVGPTAFFAASAAFLGADFLLFANDVEIPFVGLSAGVFLGLLLVPLSVVTGGLGVALSSAKK